MPHWVTHLLDDLTDPHAAMALAHLAAAVVVAWWLAEGESALWTILVLLGASVVRPRLLAPLTGGLGRRGPPLIVI